MLGLSYRPVAGWVLAGCCPSKDRSVNTAMKRLREHRWRRANRGHKIGRPGQDRRPRVAESLSGGAAPSRPSPEATVGTGRPPIVAAVAGAPGACALAGHAWRRALRRNNRRRDHRAPRQRPIFARMSRTTLTRFVTGQTCACFTLAHPPRSALTRANLNGSHLALGIRRARSCGMRREIMAKLGTPFCVIRTAPSCGDEACSVSSWTKSRASRVVEGAR